MSTSKKRGIHWLAPASATGALVAGLLLTVGHHLFYQSLHETPVCENAFFYRQVSQQQINIAIGTAFAFLAKACMVLAVSIAFVQIFWYATSQRTGDDFPTLERIDAVYSVLDNAIEMFNVKLWYNYPLLMLIAALAWLVPIASVITPATLSVLSAPVSPLPQSLTHVPNIDFRNLNYLAQMPYNWVPRAENYTGPQPYYFDYIGPSDDLLRMTNAVTSNGDIMPITPPGLNASWSLDFYGPSLECDDVVDAVRDDFMDGLVKYLRNTKNGGAQQQYGYIAWYPTFDAEEIRVPATANRSDATFLAVNSDSALVDVGSLVQPATVPTLDRSSKPLEMMVLTQSFKPLSSADPEKDPALKLRSCQLFNTTYHVLFDYTSGNQIINVTTATDPDEGPVHSIPGVLHKHVNAATDFEGYPCSQLGGRNLRCCYNSPSLLPTLSYQAIMDAFTQSMKGVIYMDGLKSDGVWMGSATSFYTDTDIMQTRLSQSDDLAYLRTALRSQPEDAGALTFQAVIAENNSSVLVPSNGTTVDFTGTYTTTASRASASGKLLSETIEELFTNLTISLMSSAVLQPNYTSSTAPSPATVSFHRYHNIYTYSAQKLWLSYGIALALTTLALVAGLITMFMNKASYSNTFSTILRAAHGAQLSAKILDQDMRGQDPLPGYLANAKVWLHSDGVTSTPNVSAERQATHRGLSKIAVSTVRRLSSDGTRDMDIGSRSHGRRGA